MRFVLRLALWVGTIGTALVWIRALRPRWRQLYPSGALPSRRWQHRAIFDVAANEMVVYGGKSNETGPDVNFNDVWILRHADNTGGSLAWVQTQPGGVAPLARHMHSAVYDPTSRAITIFGGHLDVVDQLGNDVWVLTSALGPGTPTWTQLFPTGTAPSRREWHSAIYDPGSSRMVVFGGLTGSGDGNVWILEHANGAGGTPAWLMITPPATGPSPRYGHSAVYDPLSNRMIIFGGRKHAGGAFTSDVWLLSHANGLGGTPAWTQLTASGVPPAPRADHTAVYDPAENRMVIFAGWTLSGGDTYFNDAWVLTHANGIGGFPAWRALAPLTAPPEKRELHSAVYNPSSKRMIVFGGAVSASSMRNDVWLLLNATDSA